MKFKIKESGSYDKGPVYKQYEKVQAELRKFWDMWKSIEKQIDRAEWNELRGLHGDAGTMLAKLSDKLREIEMRNEACKSDKDDEEETHEEINDANEEADGSMGDLGAPPSDANPLLKRKIKWKLCKDGEIGDGECDANESSIDEVTANKDKAAAKMAKKKAIAKSKVKCKGNMTPELVPGPKMRYKCTPIDKEASRKASKARKKFAKSGAGKQAAKAAAKTKEFRKKG